jgi:hypothetical protein
MMPYIRPWQPPRPKPGEYIVDIQWWDGECISQPFKSVRSANKLAESMIAHVGLHAIMVRSVAIYFHSKGNP